MTRQEKYPDTNTFHYYNANPKNKLTGDCVARAICTALEQSWEQTVRELTELSIKTGYSASSKMCFEKYLKNKGWTKHKQPRKDDNTKYTGKEFCEYLQIYSDNSFVPFVEGNIIANIGGHHIVAFIEEDETLSEYRCYDTWDSTDGCIGNYWYK